MADGHTRDGGRHTRGGARRRRWLFASLLVGGGVLTLAIACSGLAPYAQTRVADLPAAQSPLSGAQPLDEIYPTPGSGQGGESRLAELLAEELARQPAAGGRAAPELAGVALVPTPAAPPTRLVIPSVSIDAPIVPIRQRLTRVGGERLTTSRVPTKGSVGWHETTAGLGVAGNTVMNGHNSGFGEVFRDLFRLEEGDTVIAYSGQIPYVHTVSEIILLEEEGQTVEARRRNARYIEETGDERLTLVTCHPYGSLRQRLVVVAFPGIRPTDRTSRRAALEE